MNTKERFDKAVTLITELIIHRTKDIEFYTKETTTNSYEEFVKIGQPYEISLEGCNNTIYGNNCINILARAWHDDVHYWNKLNFEFEDEKTVCSIQMNELLYWSLNELKDRRTTLDAMQLIYEDIIGQYGYYLKHNKFVPNQYKYVYNRFKKKIENEK